MKKVNFFIVGQAKSGTTALADFLNQHPEICMSEPKEPGYFAKDLIKESDEFHGKKIYKKARTIKEYEGRFKHCRKSAKILGDATPIYIYSKVAAEEIHKYNPAAKIIILLRNPVDFLHSLHMQYVNDGSEDTPVFYEALAKEKQRENKKNVSKYAVCPSLHLYSKRAEYSEQISRYTKYFNKADILFLTHEGFVQNNMQTYRKVLSFLDIKDKEFEPNLKQINISRAPKSVKAHRLFNNMLLKNLIFSILSPKNYAKVRDFVAGIIMSPQKRQPIDKELQQHLVRKTSSEVHKTSKITGLRLNKIWGYK